MGAAASLLVLLGLTPSPTPSAGYAMMRGAMAAVGTWILFPGLALTLVAGLLAMAFNPAYQNASWAWVKLASGVVVFECFVRVQGSMQEQAEQSASALAGHVDPTMLGGSLGAERITLWVLLAVATVNVVLGIWRPRLTRSPG